MTSLVRLETFLEAVFLWIIPLAAALSIAVTASLKTVFAPSALLFVTSSLTFLERVFSLVFIDRFLRVIFFVCLHLFMADLFFFSAALAGKNSPPSFSRLIMNSE